MSALSNQQKKSANSQEKILKNLFILNSFHFLKRYFPFKYLLMLDSTFIWFAYINSLLWMLSSLFLRILKCVFLWRLQDGGWSSSCLDGCYPWNWRLCCLPRGTRVVFDLKVFLYVGNPKVQWMFYYEYNGLLFDE